MKTKRTYGILFSILAALLVITGCNADASAGLFRQISESTKPVGIQYRQILGKPATDLYFTTSEGISFTTGTTTTQIKTNTADSRNLAAYVDNANNRVLFLINDPDSTTNSAKVRSVSTVSPYTESSNLDPSFALLSSYKIHNLYTNGLFLLQGTHATNGKTFSLSTYATNAFTNVVSFDAATHGLADYSLESVLQATGKETIGISTQPIIVSFVSDAGNYKHFYTDGASKEVITLDTRLANFTILNSRLYLLTTDGKLYDAGSSAIGAGRDLSSVSSMISSNKVYDANAFMYGVRDAGGSKSHIITKSKSSNDPLYVLSFADSSTTATGESIRYGYGEYLDSAEIVSSYEKGLNNLLVATAENGMFELTIIPASANSNSTSNGTSRESEDYTL